MSTQKILKLIFGINKTLLDTIRVVSELFYSYCVTEIKLIPSCSKYLLLQILIIVPKISVSSNTAWASLYSREMYFP